VMPNAAPRYGSCCIGVLHAASAVAAAMLLLACGTGEEPTLGLGEVCENSSQCLAERVCLTMTPGLPTVCGDVCTVGSEGCASRFYPDAFCTGGAEGAVGFCAIPCESDDRCPGDLACGDDGWCAPPGGSAP